MSHALIAIFVVTKLPFALRALNKVATAALRLAWCVRLICPHLLTVLKALIDRLQPPTISYHSD